MDDLVDAHVLALGKLEGGAGSGVYNLGTETGSTVLEVIEGCRRVTGCEIRSEFVGRRAGDPEVLVASYGKAKEGLGWVPKKSLEDCIRSAWGWHSKNPNGW